MDIQYLEKKAQDLVEYALVPIAFKASSHIDLNALESQPFRLVEVPVEPFAYDYDVFETPPHWAERWNLDAWLILMAYASNQPVGGTVVAWNTPGVDMLEGRSDLAVMWDLRVHPDFRGQGLGSQLFQKAVDWAKARGCTQLNVETQDINPSACKFYASRGCEPLRITREAYADCPGQAQIIWSMRL